MNKPLILLGGGGHAKVLIEALRRLNCPLLGFLDPHPGIGSVLLGVSKLGGDEVVNTYQPDEIELVNGIGSLPNDRGLRVSLFKAFSAQGYGFKTVLDAKAVISPSAQIMVGVQVMAGSIIQAEVNIGFNSIINTGAIVEHDCRIGEHVHIAPGAVLSGGVEVGAYAHIGTGAIIIQGVKIGAGSIIGAGSVIMRDVPGQHIVYPARSHTQALNID
ncbi:MAG: acetyltransferase [Methylococcales bacterium]